MVKASLRNTSTAKPTIEVDASPVTAPGGVQVESRTTVATSPENAVPAGGLENLVGEDAHVVEDGPETTAVARRPDNASALTTRPPVSQDEGFDGDWGIDDLKHPQLKQVQGSGALSQLFDNGTIIYGDVELLPAPSVKADAKNPPIIFVPVSITKQFREKLPKEAVDAGEMPRIFNSVQEVEDAGLTTRWVGNVMPDNFAEPSARCLFLLQQPEGSEHPGFSLELDGKNYGVAVYYAAGGAFRDSAKIIYNTAKSSLLVPVLGEDNQPKKTPSGLIIKKVMLHKNFWSLNFAKKQAGNFTPWRPIVKLQAAVQTTPQVRAYIEQLLHGTPEAEALD